MAIGWLRICEGVEAPIYSAHVKCSLAWRSKGEEEDGEGGVEGEPGGEVAHIKSRDPKTHGGE